MVNSPSPIGRRLNVIKEISSALIKRYTRFDDTIYPETYSKEMLPLFSLCKNITYFLRNYSNTKNTWLWLAFNAPYRFTVLENGLLLPVNRAYKPLGVADLIWIDYEAYQDQAIPAHMLNLDWCYQENWLYDDTCSPDFRIKYLRAYFVRLKGILKLIPPPDLA